MTGKKTIPDAARAVEVQHRFGRQRMRVYLNGPVDLPQFADLRTELADEKHIEFVTEPSRCQMQVRFRKDRLETLSADGFTLSTPIEVSRPNAAARVADQLEKWAKWFNILQVTNPGEGPAVDFTILTSSGGSMQPLQSLFGKAQPALKDADKVELTIRNQSGKDLYIAVLDLSTDGSIEISYPRDQGAAELLKAGQPISTPLQMFVPAGRSVVKDTFKMFASTKPIDFTPITQGRIKGAPDLPPGSDPLNDVLAEAAGRFRGSRPVDLGEWTTIQRTVIVRR